MHDYRHEMYLRLWADMRRAAWDRQVPKAPRLRRDVEREVERLHSRPRGRSDTVLGYRFTFSSEYETLSQPTYGNYWMSRRWWRDLWRVMKRAFQAEVADTMGTTEPDWAERRRQVGGVLTGPTS
jgi:hypothetical protein